MPDDRVTVDRAAAQMSLYTLDELCDDLLRIANGRGQPGAYQVAACREVVRRLRDFGRAPADIAAEAEAAEAEANARLDAHLAGEPEPEPEPEPPAPSSGSRPRGPTVAEVRARMAARRAEAYPDAQAGAEAYVAAVDAPGAGPMVAAHARRAYPNARPSRSRQESNARAATMRCRDCGEPGARTGHMECQYPQDHADAGAV